MQHEIRVGYAGWAIPKAYAHHLPATGTHLERYSARFTATEINSSIYRLHGSPKRYSSAYTQTFLEDLVHKLSMSVRTAPTLCIFDNTTSDAAIANALATVTLLEK